ncbi:Synaptobrevin [Carpediemonas membranifera]|uniref:Synaptobrevin n=1 Tax=Carpediemonas membranifera TaxID=201153 RepID=A0A8J6AVS3_9EUKA|nr:Synaptobrevin [Carpediemonas membranifera]|eukprot:KAG9395428.1 Synaptobrevin [Carpediemonas membranifera]
MSSPILCGALFKRVCDENAAMLALEYNLQSINMLLRGKAKEIIRFGCRTVAGRVPLGQSGAISYKEFMIFYMARRDGLIMLIVSDENYPATAGREACRRILDDFDIRHGGSDFSNLTSDAKINFPELRNKIVLYQDPTKADKTMAIQSQLDATKRVMVQNLDALLKRGEQVDNLIEVSEDLSSAAKMFAKQARKTNQCCVAM